MITPIRGRKLEVEELGNPDRGGIRNDNPDKGTETDINVATNICNSGLEMITPIRGRKQ